MVSTVHLIGVMLTVALLLAVSWLSGRTVKDARAFTIGGSSGSWMVCGALLGTLAGGQSTIGTAQLAFSYGVSAWWFTIGAGLGAALLGIAYAGPLRRSGCSTLLEVVAREYGRKAETVGSILFLIGIFISIVSQVLSSSAMIGSLFGMPSLWAAIASAVLIMLLVLFGGIKSTGVGGIVKLALLYLSSLAAGIVVWHITGGLTGLKHGIDSIYASPALSAFNGMDGMEAIHHRYGSIVARGPLKDLGGWLAMLMAIASPMTRSTILKAITTAQVLILRCMTLRIRQRITSTLSLKSSALNALYLPLPSARLRWHLASRRCLIKTLINKSGHTVLIIVCPVSLHQKKTTP